MTLKEELEQAKRSVSTDDYSMSIGELANMYRDGEIEINPNFQRLFRWSGHQKSQFFESLLVGIPIPPIFVFEKNDNTWELIDGLQRLSTILEFQGLLKLPSGDLAPPSMLQGTEYLPSLEGVVWDADLHDNCKDARDIGSDLRVAIKRAKIGVQILKKESDIKSKYDLFQRLNGSGSELTSQEFRTCVMVMLNEDKYEEVKLFSENLDFIDLMQLSDERIEKQEALDRACRFLVHMSADIPKGFDVDEFITHHIKEIFVKNDVKINIDKGIRTASLLKQGFGVDALKKYDGTKFSGRVGRIGFECVFVGVAHNIDDIENLKDPRKYLTDKLTQFWNLDEASSLASAGVRGSQRIEKTIPLGKQFFAVN